MNIDYEANDRIKQEREFEGSAQRGENNFSGIDFISKLGTHIFCNCNKNNVDAVMQDISDKDGRERTYIPCDQEKSERTHFILFIQEELLPKSYLGVNRKNYNYSLLKNKLVGYKPVKAYSFENQIVIMYSKKDYNTDIENDPKYLIPFEGVGDLFMQYSILHRFIEDGARDCNLSMICIGNNGTVESLSMLLQQKITLQHISTGAKYLDWCTLISKDCIYPLFTDFLEGCKKGGKYSEGEYHIIDIIKDILQVDKNFDPYTCSEFLKQISLDYIPEAEKKYVDELVGTYGNKLFIRVPVIPGFNDQLKEIEEIAHFVAGCRNIKGMELLPYHKLGRGKYYSLGRAYLLEDIVAPSAEHMAKLHGVLAEYDIPVYKF